jgi:hypothetical protein
VPASQAMAVAALAAAAAEIVSKHPRGPTPMSGEEATEVALAAVMQAARTVPSALAPPAAPTTAPSAAGAADVGAAVSQTLDGAATLPTAKPSAGPLRLPAPGFQPGRAGLAYMQRKPVALPTTRPAADFLAAGTVAAPPRPQRASGPAALALGGGGRAGAAEAAGANAVQRLLDVVWGLRVSRGGGGARATTGEVFLDLDCGQFGGSWRVCGAEGSGASGYIGADADRARLGEAQKQCLAVRPMLQAEWVAKDFRSPEGATALLGRTGGFAAVGLRVPLAWDGMHGALDLMRAVCRLLRVGGWCWAVALNCDAVVEQFGSAGAASASFGPFRVTAECSGEEHAVARCCAQ